MGAARAGLTRSSRQRELVVPTTVGLAAWAASDSGQHIGLQFIARVGQHLQGALGRNALK